MPSKFQLPKDLRQRISALATDLSTFADDARDAFDERSERWRDGDDGMAADSWIETIGDLADQLENLPDRHVDE